MAYGFCKGGPLDGIAVRTSTGPAGDVITLAEGTYDYDGDYEYFAFTAAPVFDSVGRLVRAVRLARTLPTNQRTPRSVV